MLKVAMIAKTINSKKLIDIPTLCVQDHGIVAFIFLPSGLCSRSLLLQNPHDSLIRDTIVDRNSPNVNVRDLGGKTQVSVQYVPQADERKSVYAKFQNDSNNPGDLHARLFHCRWIVADTKDSPTNQNSNYNHPE